MTATLFILLMFQIDDLVTAAQLGDEQAFVELCKCHSPMQPVITAAGYSSQADQFQNGGCLPRAATCQPCLLATIFKVCSCWLVQLANRLERF
jgi:hypothetical protein